VSEETTIQRLSTEGADMLTLAGVNDENLVELARQTGAKIALRGETLAISGNSDAVARAVPIAQRMIDTAKQQMPLTADDVLSARKFDDAVARGAYPVDIHNPTGTGTVLKRLPPGEAYDIPLRCLMPKSADGLVVAGRCISGTHEAHSSYRVMPIVMATGQAAGVCGALAARRSVMPREVAVEQIQRELVRQGASLRPDLLRAKEAAAAK